jgi:hypothetical protein
MPAIVILVDDSYPPIKRAAFRQLSKEERTEVWDRFHLKFGFDRSAGLRSPVINDPVPSITFDLGVLAEGLELATAVDAIEAEALRCFVTALFDVETLLVLDWQHPAFEFRPKVEALDTQPKDPVNGYPGVYPDGDYYAYLTPDFSEGTFGHPWEPSLCVIGPRMIDSPGRSLSTWLPVKRIDGRAPLEDLG